MAETLAVQRECTAEEGELWTARYTEGYRCGRSDMRSSTGHLRWPERVISIPADVPGESGAQYVARHFGIAWQIGYSRAYLYYSAR